MIVSVYKSLYLVSYFIEYYIIFLLNCSYCLLFCHLLT
nr:MAG TPA: hypothetical protein [Caudoviricetes sp.]